MHKHNARLKQTNKKHKKGGAGRRERFKTGSKPTKRVGIKKKDRGLGKEGRVNRAKQILKEKRAAQWLKSRVGGISGPPKVVALIGLSELADTSAVLSQLLGYADSTCQSCTTPGQGQGTYRSVTATYSQYKQRFLFMDGLTSAGAALDAAKVADIVMLILPMQSGIDSALDHAGELILSLLKSQGLPSVVGVVQGLDMLNSKQAAEAKKVGNRFFQTEFGDSYKSADSQNQIQLFRALTTVSPRSIFWRGIRSYVVSESLSYTPDDNEPGMGTLKVNGYIRGKPLDVNQLVHISGAGTFKLKQIDQVQEPTTLKQSSHHTMDSLDEFTSVLATADQSKQESLELEAEPDLLAGEQTWPTEEEMQLAEEEVTKTLVEKKALAKKHGLDDITAAWADYLGEDFVVDEEKVDAEDMADEEDKDDDEELEDMAVTEEELRQIKLKAKERDDEEFPDEIDTPLDKPARTRFARYRALKSFRTSFWDPMENLPRDYSRIFRFEDFPLAQKRIIDGEKEVEKSQNKAVLAEKTASLTGSRSRTSSLATIDSMEIAEDSASQATGEMTTSSLASSSAGPIVLGFESRVSMGTYVCLHVANVPADIAAECLGRSSGEPIVLYSLLQLENKLSVLHFLIQKHPSCEEAIPSKEELIFKTGFRSFSGRTVFSQNSLNSDKHKYERFLPAGVFTVASMYGPVTFQPCPVTVFKKQQNGELSLVATGTLQSVDPNRLVVKRVMLTGYPVKVKKRTATVKYMFFNPEDVKWFKPAELVTKHGLTGHIKEPLGTHGLFKTYFNKPIKQHDTVCLNLYKRVFPKFPKDSDKVHVS